MMDEATTTSSPPSQGVAWRRAVAKYQKPDLRRSVWQVVNTLIPYCLFWYVMYRSLEVSYGMTLAFAVPTAGFLVRLFIIFHDCGHGSFFASQRANDLVGFVAGVLTLTPYYGWTHEHAMHHATAGDLDRRGVGDIWTMTVREYLQASPGKRFAYRLYRNPLVMFVVGPAFLFLIWHRIPSRTASRRDRLSVHWTNVAILGMVVLMSGIVGLKAYMLVQLPVVLIAGAAGVWLFYVQHQYEGVYWERHEQWDYVAVALEGSSFYKLPRVLQWFTGNIGFHHVHHLNPRIPNYYLQRCHEAVPMFQEVQCVTLWGSLKSLAFRLWDEDRRQLVGFGHLKTLQKVGT
jgi:acyl-lipid omega-6 desaturase (Delta-12 desaturase)